MQGFLVVTYRDTFNQETTRRYELRDGSGAINIDRLASLYNRAEMLFDAITPVTGAAVVNVGIDITDPEFTLVPVGVDTLSNVSDDGVLSVALVNASAKKGTLRIPAPLSTILTPSGAPDITDAPWVALVEEFHADGSALLSDGETVDDNQGVEGVLKTWRASRGRRSE
jgi:hypothetical protein